MELALGDLENRIGYQFRDRSLLLRALTHKSLVPEALVVSETPLQDNEQFEFLGDAVLGFVASDYLVRVFPSYPEGKLTKLKAMVVSATNLHAAALRVELGSCLRMGKGEEQSGGRAKRALLANAMEALIAAVYLDGGLEPCRRILEQVMLSGLDLQRAAAANSPPDAKSALQELAQAQKLPVPRYHLVAEKGPEHAKTFTVEVRVGAHWHAQATGSSKKEAGHRAAHGLLEKLLTDGRPAEPAPVHSLPRSE